MKYIKTYEFFKPIKINSAKPFKVKKNLDKSIQYLQKGIKSLRGRLEDQKSATKRAKMNQDVSKRIQRLKDLSFKKLKQAEHFRNNPIKESVDEENGDTLLTILTSENFKPEDVENIIELDENKYELKIPAQWNDSKLEKMYNSDGFDIIIESENLESLMGVEQGIIRYFLNISSYYGDYEYYAAEDLAYIDRYLSKEILEKIKKLGELFDHKIDPEEEGEIEELYKYLSLDSDLNDFEMEIANENERAVQKAVQKVLEDLPFTIDHNYQQNGKFDLELNFNYSEIIEYLEKHEMKVKNIKELFENLYEAGDFGYEIEYEGKYDFLGDFEGLVKIVEESVDKYLDSPDSLFPILIQKDNLELFKNKLDLAYFDFDYDGWYEGKYRESLNLLEISTRYKNRILEWFKTYDFQKNLIDEDQFHKTEKYKELTKLDIINHDIKEEYSYLIDVEKYNM